MLRSTKIVATLGPASSDPAVLEKMIRAGVDVVRLNFSHGTAEDHLKRAQLVQGRRPQAVGRTVGIMADLQGPKIRVGKFADGKIMLEPGQTFVLDAEIDMGNAERAGLDYKELPRDVSAGAVLLLDDGKIVLDVTAVRGIGGPHHGAPRRRALEQQGHQPPGRRAHRAGADRQGHGGHQDRRASSRPTTSRCRFPRPAPTCTWRAN